MSAAAEPSRSVNLSITGMHCGGCVRAVTRAIGGVEGATAEQVRVGSATVLVAPGASEQQVVEAIRAAGYDARVQD
jgi:copper chaperone CopZ